MKFESMEILLSEGGPFLIAVVKLLWGLKQLLEGSNTVL